MEPVAVYVHIPFCPSKCGYCDFNSYAMEGEIVDRTVDAQVLEISRSVHRGRPAKTIFFGGGTPTFIPVDGLLRILSAVLEAHPPVEGCEITSEANPGTVDASKFALMRAAGFNRLSLGAQSFDTGDLLRLGRVHDPGQVGRAIELARSAGFDNLNIDLMFALPGQKLSGWKRNLDLALQCGTDHLSLYGLTIEQNTRFYKLNQRGMLDLPPEDVQVEMYDLAVSACTSAGMGLYEISNFAKPGFECRHNLCYWRNEEYLGYGPGAVGSTCGGSGRVRTTNLKSPLLYCEAVEGGKAVDYDREVLDPSVVESERVMMGLRLAEGVSLGSSRESERYEKQGLLLERGGRLALTHAGRHVANRVIADLM